MPSQSIDLPARSACFVCGPARVCAPGQNEPVTDVAVHVFNGNGIETQATFKSVPLGAMNELHHFLSRLTGGNVSRVGNL